MLINKVAPRMRTIGECMKMLREDDPNTAVTLNALRNMVLSNRVPYFSVGNKRLVNYDKLLEILQNPVQHEDVVPAYGKIRKIG